MEIIERYIYAIQRRLPSKNQKDIAKEINSLIYDELEDKYGNKDEYQKDEIESVIKEMGHPREVAARYRGEKQVIIGEELLPIYKMVLAITLGATALGLIISFIVSLINHGDEATAEYFLKSIFELFGSVFSAGVGAVGTITIIFYLIQRFGKFDDGKIDFYDDWTPSDLPELPEDKERVKVAEPIVAMFFIVVGFLFVNFFIARGNLPYYMGEGSEVKVLPIFNVEVVKHLLPFWNLSFAMSFVLQIILLIHRKWSTAARFFEIAISLLGIAILVAMLNLPMIFAIDNLLVEYGAREWIDVIANYYYIFIKISIGFSILGIVVNVIKVIVNQSRKANV